MEEVEDLLPAAAFLDDSTAREETRTHPPPSPLPERECYRRSLPRMRPTRVATPRGCGSGRVKRVAVSYACRVVGAVP